MLIHTALNVYVPRWNRISFVWFTGNTLAYILNKHTNMSIHICVLLIKLSMLVRLGSCVCSYCVSVCVSVSVCVCFEAGGWLPEATALKCVKWGSSQRWALGYEVALRGVCVCTCVVVCVWLCVCVTYISDICRIHWHICWCEWHWARRPAPSIPSPPHSLWHGTVLHLVHVVMRQTDGTEGGFQGSVRCQTYWHP